MTSYAASIDRTEESANGCKFTAIASGAITAGNAVKYNGTTAKTVIVTSATSSLAVGVAATTVADGQPVLILSNGCKFLATETLTLGGKVGVAASGALTDFSANTVLGVVETGGAGTSVVKVQIQY
ncbi:Uncharacterised protein [Candidatus Anstonella stagnisolia]|nr:Uncharacterised protein [Candidatus Anstonella stagnisolia]